MRFRALLSLATVAALIIVGASSAYAGGGAYQWGLTVTPGTNGQPVTVFTPSVVLDYGTKPPGLVSVTPYLHMLSGPASPTNTYPTCSAFLYRNGAQWGAQSVGPDTPAPYAWDLDMTPAPITWKVVINCPLPQGASGNPDVDATLTSELPPAPSSPSPSPVAPTPPPTKPTPPKPTPVPATPRPAPKPVVVAPAALVAPPVLPVADTKPAAAPSPVPVASPVVTPTLSASPSPSFAAVPRAAVTHNRGFHVTFIEFLGFLVLVAGLLAARWHWAWI